MADLPLTVRERIDRVIAECSGVWSLYHVTAWEKARVLESKDRPILSEKQIEVLREIEKKVFPE